MRAKITKNLIDGLEPDPQRHQYVWDTKVAGFGFCLTKNGARSWVFQYGRGARRMRLTIGSAGTLTAEKARKIAAAHRNAVDAGREPAAEIAQAKAELTLREVGERFLTEHAAHKAPSTERLYRLVLDRYVFPALGTRRASGIRWEDVAAVLDTLRDRPTLRNRAQATLSKLFSLAARWGAFPRTVPNPAASHDHLPERRRGRALDRAQLARFGAALEAEGESFAAAAATFCLLTGCRPGEALRAEWGDIDLGRRVWHLTAGKTGERRVFLGQPAADLLARLPRLAGSPWCFPGRTGLPMVDLKSTWSRVHAAAELPEEVRLYDATRHTFTTWAAELGVPRDIRKLLTGHALGREAHDAYMHVTHEPLRQADRVSGWLRAALDREQEPRGSGVPFARA
jgi:integrase